MQPRPDEFSILNPGSREFVPLESVPFYQDLNLDQVIDKMAVRWGKDMKKYYRYLPSSSDRHPMKSHTAAISTEISEKKKYISHL